MDDHTQRPDSGLPQAESAPSAEHTTPDLGLAPKSGISRRSMLTSGAIGMAGAGLATRAAAQDEPASPALASGSVEGQEFRAFVRYGTGSEIMDLKLNAIAPRQVVVRCTASIGCYTVTRSVLGGQDLATPTIPNHSGFGVVEAVGSEVRRVKVGDRVLVSGSTECGHCYQCLHGNPEACDWLAPYQNEPVAQMADGTGVIESAQVGGLSELMVAWEAYCVPCYTDLPDEQLCMLGDTFGVGVTVTAIHAPVTAGSDVVIFGAGCIGLSATQGARARAAGQIIVIEPIPYRRERALEYGATTVIDPNVDPDGIVEQVRALCSGPSENIDAGGRTPRGFFQSRGGDFVIECVGGDLFPPTEVAGPDPSGILPLRQSWEVTRGGGYLTLLSAFQYSDISFPSTEFCLSTRTVYGGQMGGQHPLRDNPRIIKMMERGYVDAGSLITARYGLEGIVEGFQGVADRRELGVIFNPNA
ncbi:alcohol dehydrogenase catalytic domain-containing protein [Pseudoroseicyclus sp. CXY001]|uniref:alcohol dehydrogenase catalytic domain-containing protein n=1 Tax=Pseudoroseicyclus sp. CXY001 TaxID=3242492 RepID=UPI00357136C6